MLQQSGSQSVFLRSEASALPRNVCAQSLSHVQLFAILWTVAFQAPLSMEFSRPEYWSGLPFFPPGNLPDLGIKPASPVSPALQADSLLAGPIGKKFVRNMNSKYQEWSPEICALPSLLGNSDDHSNMSFSALAWWDLTQAAGQPSQPLTSILLASVPAKFSPVPASDHTHYPSGTCTPCHVALGCSPVLRTSYALRFS